MKKRQGGRSVQCKQVALESEQVLESLYCFKKIILIRS